MQDLIRDLYLKYAPNANVDDKIKYVEENYGDDVSGFINDFYQKYAPSKLNQETFDYINNNYFSILKRPEEKSPAVLEVSGVESLYKGSLEPNVDNQGNPIKASHEKMRMSKGVSQWDELKQSVETVVNPIKLANELTGKTDFLDIDEQAKIALSTPVAWVSGFRRSLRVKNELMKRHGFKVFRSDADPISKEEREEINQIIDLKEMENLSKPFNAMDFTILGHLDRITSMTKPVKKYQEDLQKQLTKYEGDIFDSIKRGNFLDAGFRIAGGVVATSPTLVAAAGGAPGLLVMGAGMYGQKFNEVFTENHDKTIGVAMLNAGSTAAIEVAGGIVSQRILFGSGILKNFMTKGPAGEAVKKYTQGAAGKLVSGIMGSMGEGTEELVVEMTTEVIDRLSLEDQKVEQVWGDLGKIAREKSDAFILGAAMGGGTATIQNLMASESAIKEHTINTFMSKGDKEYMIEKANNINKLQTTLNETKTEKGKKIIEGKIESELNDIYKRRQKVENNLKNITEAELINLGNITDKKLELIKEYKSETNEEVKLELKKQIDQLGRNASNIFNSSTKRRLNENIKFARKNKKPEDVVVHDNTDEFQDIYDNADGKKEAMDVSGVDGFYLNGVLHINRTASIETGAISVGSHELLHDIVKHAIRDVDGKMTPQGVNLIKDFKKQLSAKELKVVQERIDRNYRFVRDKDGNVMKDAEGNNIEKKFEDYGEEYLNVFHDAIVKKDIKYDSTDATWWQGVANSFAGIFRGYGYDNASFKTGKSAYNFLLDYSNRASKGEDVSDLIDKLKQEGRDLDGQIDSEKNPDKLSDLKNKRKKKKQEVREALGQQEIQKSDTRDHQSEINKLGENVTKEQWDSGKADEAISEMYYGLDGLIKSKIPSNPPPGFSREDFIASTIAELIPHIRNFNPEVNDSLSGWINSQLSNKIGNVFKKGAAGTKDVFETDITEAKKVAAEETEAPKVTKKPKARKIHPLDLVRDAKLKKQYTEDVEAKIKDVDVSKLTFKNLKDLSADNTAKIFGIPTKKVTNPMANLSKQEKENALQFIRANALELIQLLPEGAVTEAATEKLMGTSTGVPNSLLKRFYEKQARETTGSGLPTYKLKENISKKEFLEAFGVVDGKKSTDFGPRTPEAQAVKAMVSLYGKVSTNTAVREILKDQLSKEKLQDIAAGKNIIQLSESQASIDTRKETGGFLDSSDSDHVSRLNTFFTETIPKYFNPSLILNRPSLISFGNRYDLAFSGRGFWLTDPNKGKTNEMVRKNNGAVVAGELNSVKDVKEQADVNYGKSDNKTSKKNEAVIDVALSPKTSNKGNVNKINKNIENTKKHNKGVKAFSEVIQDIYKGEGDGILPEIKEIMYHVKNNSSIARNFANLVGGQKNYNGKLTEEHKYQAIVWTKRFIQSVKHDTLDGFLKWSEKNYTQLVLDENSDSPANQKYGDWHAKSDEHPLLAKAMDEAIKTGDFSNVPDSNIRYYNEHFHLNPNNTVEFGKTHAESYNVVVPKSFENDPDVIKKQAEIIFKIASKQDIDFNPQAEMDKFIANEAKDIAKARSKNYADFDFLLESMTLSEQVEAFRNIDKAMDLARKNDAPEKGISVFDFDQTLANTTETVKYELSDGTKGELTARQFADQGVKLEEQGATFDFSNFEKVKGATKGPFFELAQKIKGKFGNKDIFILTARPGKASPAIKAFLKSVGLDVKLDNIIGLEDGRPAAKANFVIKKAAEGYNNFFFGDDVYSNVKIVQDVLSVVDIKGDVRQAKISFSKSMDAEFNKIIELNTDVGRFKAPKRGVAQARGKKVGKVTKDDKILGKVGKKVYNLFSRLFTPPGAEDIKGLLYQLIGKGNEGVKQFEFLKKAVIDPFNRADKNMEKAKVKISAEYGAIKDKFKDVTSKLNKITAYGDYTFDQAIRVYLMEKSGIKIPSRDISIKAKKALLNEVKNDKRLLEFANEVSGIHGMNGGYLTRTSEGWLGSTIENDLNNKTENVDRSEYLEEWKQNKDIIFSEKNLNKLESIYGKPYVEALENVLERMEKGSNRVGIKDKYLSNAMDFLNKSTASIMFFNMRSASLQLISFANFIQTTGPNNIIKFGKAILNVEQHAEDFAMIMNSDFLKQRRSGLQMDINSNEIAGYDGWLEWLLKKGYIPTRTVDSIAIAFGGATFYRNTLNKLIKDGVPEADAKKQAFDEMRNLAEESQQSSRPDKISAQQASPAGRFALAFANTPMQYTRIMKRSAQDLINRRGDPKEHISKILYYGVIQNVLFNGLQQAVFALAFADGEEEDEKRNKRELDIINGMLDTILRGSGIAGATLAMLKNMTIEFIKQDKKGYAADHWKTVMEAPSLIPPLGSKADKLYKAFDAMTDSKVYNKSTFGNNFEELLESPALEVAGRTTSVVWNIPLDRLVQKTNNVKDILKRDTENWERVALFFGWPKWSLEVDTGGRKERKRKTRSRKKRERK